MTKEIDRQVRWVEENLPHVLIRGSDEVRRIVKDAMEQVQGIRTVVSIVGGAIGALAGYFLSTVVFDDSRSKNEYVFLVLTLGILATFVSAKLSESILHRRIATLARRA